MQNARQGRCLCGRVRFAIDAGARRVGMCHCSKCRRASGAASNAVLIVAPHAFEWLSGQRDVRLYVDGGGWRTAFCATCGCPAPVERPGAAGYWIPAGALEDDEGLHVIAHIFVNSKASWERIGGDAPQWPEAPPGR